MDGTFKVVPQWYQQLFTIHAYWRISWCQQSTVDVRGYFPNTKYRAATSTSTRRYIRKSVTWD
ncbi:hypothetical protein T05_2866 [Trichinella murrelli]|uniref:Uncharacterized protein n=1 Tax=Trichinella murrelli TaxID=144512 RepID=A0A0V0T2M2_9BILA|nr:hypothetical protein T05_7693 [Trichinella murrelli]KRX34775.1 hypothetical protein T05_2866 [Trichinella murrelli]